MEQFVQRSLHLRIYGITEITDFPKALVGHLGTYIFCQLLYDRGRRFDYSAEDNILFGSVIGVRGLISYEGKSIDEFKVDFEEAVDSYLEMCEVYGVEPEKYYKGVIIIRFDSELHRQATIAAQSKHETLNEFIKGCI